MQPISVCMSVDATEHATLSANLWEELRYDPGSGFPKRMYKSGFFGDT